MKTCMTIRRLVLKKYGKKGYDSLSSRLRGIFARVDALNANEKPVSRKQLAEALR